MGGTPGGRLGIGSDQVSPGQSAAGHPAYLRNAATFDVAFKIAVDSVHYKAQRQVQICRVEKMYDDKFKRLTINLRDPNIQEKVSQLLEAAGIEEFLGSRPAGALEAEAQKLIDASRA